jgi:hypothetical protein
MGLRDVVFYGACRGEEKSDLMRGIFTIERIGSSLVSLNSVVKTALYSKSFFMNRRVEIAT